MNSKSEAAVHEQHTQYKPRKLYALPLTDLHPDQDQPRKHIDLDDADLKDLASSIEKHGVLQPILFRQAEDGNLMIVSGERRYQACRLANKTTIPAIFIVGNAPEIALVENMQRVDLTPIEEAEGLGKLQKDAGYKNKELAAVISKAESTISEILSLNQLPQIIRDEIRKSKDCSRRQLVEVAKGKTDKQRMKLFQALQMKSASRDQLREKRQRDDDSVLMTMINGLTTKLNAIELKDLNDDKRDMVKDHLMKLGDLILQKTC